MAEEVEDWTAFVAPIPIKRPKKKAPPKMRLDERDARSALVLARRIQGRTMREITDEFNISRATFYRALSQARRENLLEEAKDAILGLIPKAISAYDAALSRGDTDVATAVLEGAGVIGKQMFMTPALDGASDVTFTALRARIIRKVTGVDVTGDLDDVPAMTLAAPAANGGGQKDE